MTYNDYLRAAKFCSNPAQADDIIKKAENDNAITDRQFYNIRHVAIESAYTK